MDIAKLLDHARRLAALADDKAAQSAYVEVLRHDPSNLSALTELGNLALSGGFRSAAITAYRQAVHHHPRNAVARINLAQALRQDNDFAGARQQYEAALQLDAALHEAHQGMAWALADSDPQRAERHFRQGYTGRALVTRPYRGTGVGVPVLMLVSARGGNIPTQLWMDDRRFTVHALYAEFYDPAHPLPAHAVVLNAIGDADLCQEALARAADVLTHSAAPVINPPDRVRPTGRAAIARRLGRIPGVIAPRIDTLSRDAILARAGAGRFPVLLRKPGFHTGEHFVYVADRGGLAPALASLPAGELLSISYLDARGADGMARKYRVMFIDGTLYPLHLAISRDWKVHYFTANMAEQSAYRAEEQRFLEDMPAVLGVRAMRALQDICDELGLQYAGIDFALDAVGSVLLFEANATMVVFPPGPDPMWDYRRPAIAAVLDAAGRMIARYADPVDGEPVARDPIDLVGGR